MDNICVGDRKGVHTFKRTRMYIKTQKLKQKDELPLIQKKIPFYTLVLRITSTYVPIICNFKLVTLKNKRFHRSFV